MKKHGTWMKWEQAMDRKVTWQDIWKWNPQRIKFLIQGVYDILPSPDNLFVWGKVETPSCPLYSKTGTLEHILSSCSWAPGDGQYRWRHDQVLKAIALAIKGIGESRKVSVTTRMITFVKKGEQSIRKNYFVGLLFTARDWLLTVDLNRQLKIPAHITQTMLRRHPGLGVHKTVNFTGVNGMRRGWKRHRRERGESMRNCRRPAVGMGGKPDVCQWRWVSEGLQVIPSAKLMMVGITGANRRRAINKSMEAAEQASRWKWLKRGEVWGP